MEREREREEEWARKRAEWQAQEDQRRQWNEQQARFNEVTSDVEQWLKAEHLRAYATAYEAHQITTRGCIDAGGSIDALASLDSLARESSRPDYPAGRPKTGHGRLIIRSIRWTGWPIKRRGWGH